MTPENRKIAFDVIVASAGDSVAKAFRLQLKELRSDRGPYWKLAKTLYARATRVLERAGDAFRTKKMVRSKEITGSLEEPCRHLERILKSMTPFVGELYKISEERPLDQDGTFRGGKKPAIGLDGLYVRLGDTKIREFRFAMKELFDWLSKHHPEAVEKWKKGRSDSN